MFIENKQRIMEDFEQKKKKTDWKIEFSMGQSCIKQYNSRNDLSLLVTEVDSNR